jgi:hypothetical protein
MPHDDDSAEIFSVKGRGRETLWQCCGKTVEGEGDMGPPDGWCYEGFHTVCHLIESRYSFSPFPSLD